MGFPRIRKGPATTPTFDRPKTEEERQAEIDAILNPRPVEVPARPAETNGQVLDRYIKKVRESDTGARLWIDNEPVNPIEKDVFEGRAVSMADRLKHDPIFQGESSSDLSLVQKSPNKSHFYAPPELRTEMERKFPGAVPNTIPEGVDTNQYVRDKRPHLNKDFLARPSLGLANDLVRKVKDVRRETAERYRQQKPDEEQLSALNGEKFMQQIRNAELPSGVGRSMVEFGKLLTGIPELAINTVEAVGAGIGGNWDHAAEMGQALASMPADAVGSLSFKAQHTDMIAQEPLRTVMEATTLVPFGPKAAIAPRLAGKAMDAARAAKVAESLAPRAVEIGKAVGYGAAAVPTAIAELGLPGEGNLINLPVKAVAAANKGLSAVSPSWRRAWSKPGDLVGDATANAEQIAARAVEAPPVLDDLPPPIPTVAEQSPIFDPAVLVQKYADDAEKRIPTTSFSEREVESVRRHAASATADIVDEKGNVLWSTGERPEGRLYDSTPEGQDAARAFVRAAKQSDVDVNGNVRIKVQSKSKDGIAPESQAVADQLDSDALTAAATLIRKLNVDDDVAAQAFKYVNHMREFSTDRPLPNVKNFVHGVTENPNKMRAAFKDIRGADWEERLAQGKLMSEGGTLLDRHRAQMGLMLQDIARLDASTKMIDNFLDWMASGGKYEGKVRTVNLDSISPDAQSIIASKLKTADGKALVKVPNELASYLEMELGTRKPVGWTRSLPFKFRGKDVGLGEGLGGVMDAAQRAFVNAQLFTLPATSIGNFATAGQFQLHAALKYRLPGLFPQWIKTMKQYALDGRDAGFMSATPPVKTVIAKAADGEVTRKALWEALGGDPAVGVELGEASANPFFSRDMETAVQGWRDADSVAGKGKAALDMGTAGVKGYYDYTKKLYGYGPLSDMAAKEALVVELLKHNPKMMLKDAVAIASEEHLNYANLPDAARQMSATIIPFVNWTFAATPQVAKIMSEYLPLQTAFTSMNQAAEVQRAYEDKLNLQEYNSSLPTDMQGQGMYWKDGKFLRLGRFSPRTMAFDVAGSMANRQLKGGETESRLEKSLNLVGNPVLQAGSMLKDKVSGNPILNPKTGREVGDSWGDLAVAAGSPFFIPSQASRFIEQLPTFGGETVKTPRGSEVTPEGAFLGATIGTPAEYQDPGRLNAELENSYRAQLARINRIYNKAIVKNGVPVSDAERQRADEERLEALNNLQKRLILSKEPRFFYRGR